VSTACNLTQSIPALKEQARDCVRLPVQLEDRFVREPPRLAVAASDGDPALPEMRLLHGLMGKLALA